MTDPPPLIRWLGRYSTGIRLAVEYGPASGALSEYAYRNVPEGNGILGRGIDRAFLALETWKALRQQQQSVKEMARAIVTERQQRQLPTTVLDIAAGPAPYLRDLAREMDGAELSIFCLDRNAREVGLGRRRAQAENLPNVHFFVGDALDPASYLVPMHPELILAVGLFSNLRSDDDVRTAIRLALQSAAPGGFFLATSLAEPSSRLGLWASRALGARPAFRPAAHIVEWFTQAGFTEVTHRVMYGVGVIACGRRPAD